MLITPFVPLVRGIKSLGAGQEIGRHGKHIELTPLIPLSY
jgi:hypothetical protein